MSSMFKGLSDALKGKPKSGFKAEGQTLGGSTSRLDRPSSRFDITFHGSSLGMTLGKQKQRETNTYATVVEKVAPKSEAAQAGIRVGSKVIAMEGNPIGTFEDFMAVVVSMGRPLVLTFEGEPPANAPSAGGKQAQQQQGRRQGGGGGGSHARHGVVVEGVGDG